MGNNTKATARQKSYMRRLGLRFQEDITKEEASYRISKRKLMFPISDRQRRAIERLGGRIDQPLLRFQAELFQAALESLWEKNGLQCPECGGQLVMILFANHCVCQQCGVDLERTNPEFCKKLRAIGIKTPESLLKIHYDEAFDRDGTLKANVEFNFESSKARKNTLNLVTMYSIAAVMAMAVVLMLIAWFLRIETEKTAPLTDTAPASQSLTAGQNAVQLAP